MPIGNRKYYKSSALNLIIVIWLSELYLIRLCCSMFSVFFLLVLLVLSVLMIWLVLGPNTIFHNVLQLYNITDMNYKLLLLALAALNFFICYLLEVRKQLGYSACPRQPLPATIYYSWVGVMFVNLDCTLLLYISQCFSIFRFLLTHLFQPVSVPFVESGSRKSSTSVWMLN